MKNCLLIFTLVFFASNIFAKPTDSLRVEVRNGAKYIVHRVVKNETLEVLAENYSTSESEIISANPLIVSEVKAGQVVFVPLNLDRYGDMPIVNTKPALGGSLPIATASTPTNINTTKVPQNNTVGKVNASGSKEGKILRNEYSGTDTFVIYHVGYESSVTEVAKKFNVPEENIHNYNVLKSIVLVQGQQLKILVGSKVEAEVIAKEENAEVIQEEKVTSTEIETTEKEEQVVVKAEAKNEDNNIKQKKKPIKFKKEETYEPTASYATNVHEYNLTDYRPKAGLEDYWADTLIQELTIDVGSLSQSKGKGTAKTTHVVKAGESLQSIAKDYRVRVTDIINWNAINNYRVREGQELIINQARFDENYYARNSISNLNIGEVNEVKRVVEFGVGIYNPKSTFIGVLHPTLPAGKIIKIVNYDNYLETYARVSGKLPADAGDNVILAVDFKVAQALKINNPNVKLRLSYGKFD